MASLKHERSQAGREDDLVGLRHSRKSLLVRRRLP